MSVRAIRGNGEIEMKKEGAAAPSYVYTILSRLSQSRKLVNAQKENRTRECRGIMHEDAVIADAAEKQHYKRRNGADIEVQAAVS